MKPRTDVPAPENEHRRASRLLPQLIKFGAVGAVGVLVNVVVFNSLMLTVFAPKVMQHGPIYATIIATTVAIITNWVGNRFWAFSAQRQTNTLREGIEFGLVSLAGMGIPILCLWISHYLLGYKSLLADNISNYIVGLAIGTVFRFALYRWWVYAPNRAGSRRAKDASTGLAASPDRRLVSDS
jgi:putative flippase GtrA